MAKRANLENYRKIGKDKNHMSGQISARDKIFDFIYFNCGDIEINNGYINFIYQLRYDYWNGKIQKKLQLLEIENC